MRRTRPLPAALLGITTALALAACGSDDPEVAGPSDPPAASASGSATGTPPASSSATGSAPAAPSGSAGATDGTASACATRPGTVPDGTWAGPVTMDVDARGGQAPFTSTKGRGTLRLVVADGKVTAGTWSVTWRSRGSADTGQAAATLTLDGRITGTAKGPARRPVLAGTWSLDGEVHLTKPIEQRAPVTETGTVTPRLTVTEASCAEVSGTFLPSFTSTEAAAAFAGSATWVGTRTD